MAEGYVITVIGGKGGVGKSQVAANLAFAFAADNRSTTLLLDFDSKACGDQDIITGLKSKKTIKDLADYNGPMDKRALTLNYETSEWCRFYWYAKRCYGC